MKPHLDFFLSISPIILLIWLMTKKNNLPSNLALPLVAVLFYILKLLYFAVDPVLVNAATLEGLLTALTPISIIFGAIFLFKTMEYSQGLPILRQWLNNITPNKTAQLMIVGWSFSFLIEGISGFGTPAALAAPLLVGFGFSVLPVAIFCLILNSVPVSFGAVGMPTWFGLGQLNLTAQELSLIGVKTATLHSLAALIIPIMALKIMLSWQEIRNNLLFIYLSILSSIVPYLILSKFTVEFPSIIGGFFGLFISVILAKFQIGLLKEASNSITKKSISWNDTFKAFFPIVSCIVILMISRLPFLNIKEWLNQTNSFFQIQLGSFGLLEISSSLVIQLKSILNTSIHWKHALLFVPSIIPFIVVSIACFIFFKMPKDLIYKTITESSSQILNPFMALLGAMVFVKLLMMGGEQSSSSMIGRSMASWAGNVWQYVAVYLGALGAFFSGSCTVSNLTFGPIQNSIAQTLELNRTTILSLQSVGGAMGNMVCIHNIVAVCAILGLHNQEGFIIKKTFKPMLVYGLIAGLGALMIFS